MPFDLLYLVLLALLSPLLAWRICRKGKYRRNAAARRGFVRERPDHPCRVWIHAVSVGEANVARPLAEAVRAEIPGCEIVVSTITPTGQEVAVRNFGGESVFYCPFDFSWMVRRVFERVKPAALILMEQEIWPNLVTEAKRRGLPVMIANGRIERTAARLYRVMQPLARRLLRHIDLFCVQDETYAARARGMGMDPRRVLVTGNLKFDAARPKADPEGARALRERFGLSDTDRVIVGGSTHPTEETALGEAFVALRARHQALRLIVAPRHPERFEGAHRDLEALGLSVVRMSRLASDERPARPDEVVIVDRMGVLAAVYQVASVVFVGGSLIPHGGQNNIEPSGLGVPTVCGPHMFNFAEAMKTLLDSAACVQVQGASRLVEALDAILSDDRRRAAMGERARRAIDHERGASARTARLLKDLLSRAAQDARRSR